MGPKHVFLAFLPFLSGCMSLERASACREFASALEPTFGHERPLRTSEDVTQLVQELEALDRRIEPWTSRAAWQGSELTVFEVELGVFRATLQEIPSSGPKMEGHIGRRIGESVRRLKHSAERLRTFCAAP